MTQNSFPLPGAKEWKPPAELRHSIPRQVEFAAGGIVIAVMAAIVGMGALAALVGLSRVAVRQAGKTSQLRLHGRETEATVTRRWRSGEENRTMVAYRFWFDGHEWKGESGLPRRIWSDLREGYGIQVRFLPFDPRTNRPTAARHSDLPFWFPYVLSAVLAACSGFLVLALRRESQLLSEGRPAPAVVTGYARAEHGKMVKYEYQVLSGARFKGKSAPKRKAPEIGSTVCIIYDPENPRRSQLYPSSIVRVAQ